MSTNNLEALKKRNAKNKKTSVTAARLCVGIGMFSALAYAVALICNSFIPPVDGFLSLDVKDSIITIASFVYGPISAVPIALISALIEFLTFSTTGWYGLVMNFVSSASFSLTASLIYSKRRTFGGSLVGIYSAVAATTSFMILMNIVVTPFYFGMPVSSVTEMIPVLLLPFNFAKALLNSSVVVFLYKPLSTALSRVGLGARSLGKFKWNKTTAISAVAGAVALAVSMTVLLILWLK